MEANNVRAENIPTEQCVSPTDEDLRGSQRYYDKPVFAWFICPKKHRYWGSARAWCVIDLKEQTICYRYKQGCKKCDSNAYPEFPERVIRKVAEFAVKWFLILTGKLECEPPNTDTVTGKRRGKGPHDEQRCDKCLKLGRCCWK